MNTAFFARHGLSANGQTTISGSNGQISVGGNVTINTSTVFIGNSTVNSVSNSSFLKIANSTSIANLQPTQLTIGPVVINASSFVANGVSVNSTGSYVTGLVNASSFTVGTSTIANNTGVYTGVVNSTSTNTATLTVGSSLDVTGTVTTAKANVVSQTLTDQATIAWNTALGQIATVTLGGNRTFGAPTNLKVGTYILHVIQDGTGSRTITWNGVFKWPAGVAPVLTTAANARDLMSFVSDGTNLYGSYLPDVK